MRMDGPVERRADESGLTAHGHGFGAPPAPKAQGELRSARRAGAAPNPRRWLGLVAVGVARLGRTARR